MVGAHKSCTVAHSATHRTRTGTITDDTVCLVRAHKSTTALQISNNIHRAVLNQTVVAVYQTGRTALCATHLTLRVTVTNHRSCPCIHYQESLCNTSHSGIRQPHILNRGTIRMNEQRFIHHREVVGGDVYIPVVGIPVVSPVHAGTVVHIINRVPVAVEMATEKRGVRCLTPLHQMVCNRFPLQPRCGVRIAKVREIDIRC